MLTALGAGSVHVVVTAALVVSFTSFFAVVVGGVKLGVVVGHLDAGDDQVVLLVWRVGPQDQSVDSIVLPFRSARENPLFRPGVGNFDDGEGHYNFTFIPEGQNAYSQKH